MDLTVLLRCCNSILKCLSKHFKFRPQRNAQCVGLVTYLACMLPPRQVRIHGKCCHHSKEPKAANNKRLELFYEAQHRHSPIELLRAFGYRKGSDARSACRANCAAIDLNSRSKRSFDPPLSTLAGFFAISSRNRRAGRVL
jgi:hypothetical protein